MKFNRKNIYLKPEIYIEEFDDADEGFMAGSDPAAEPENTKPIEGEGEGEAKKSDFTPFELNWDDDNE